MAKIRVYRDEADGDEFPRLCVRCGADADTDVRQTFAWHPPWVIVLILLHLLVYLIVAIAMRKKLTVTLPVCHRHRNHWLNRKLFGWLGLLFWIAAGVALGVLFDRLPKDAGPYAIGAVVFGALGWLITLAVLSNSAVRPREITDRYAELVNVDPAFAEAWEQDHPTPKSGRRPRPPRPRYEDDPDDRPREYQEDRYDDRPRGPRTDDRYEDDYDRR